MKKTINIITWIIYIVVLLLILTHPYLNEAPPIIYAIIPILYYLRIITSNALCTAYDVSCYKKKYGDDMVTDLVKAIDKIKIELNFGKTDYLRHLNEEIEFLQSQFNLTHEEIDECIFENTKKEVLNLSKEDQKSEMGMMLKLKTPPLEYAALLLLDKILDVLDEMEAKDDEDIDED